MFERDVPVHHRVSELSPDIIKAVDSSVWQPAVPFDSSAVAIAAAEPWRRERSPRWSGSMCFAQDPDGLSSMSLIRSTIIRRTMRRGMDCVELVQQASGATA